MTDAEIVALADRASAGDDVAWTQLYNTFTCELKGWARRAGAAPSDLDDIASVVWMRLWGAMVAGRRFESGAKLLAYLAKCARRQTIDLWRRSQARPQCYALEDADRPVLDSTLVLEFDGLTERERRLAVLLVTGYTVPDIALHDGLTCAAIYKQREHLRAKLIRGIQ